MIIRALFTKKNYLRYISHLDLVRLFHRTFNRGQLEIKYSEGFNPHPKFSIAHPLSLGIESECEYIDIDLEQYIPIDEFISRMNRALPEDIQIIKAAYVENKSSVSSIINWAFYEIKFLSEEELNIDLISEEVQKWLGSNKILISKLKRKGKNKIPIDVNIKPLIGNVVVKSIDSDGFLVINSLLKSGENGNLKPIEFVEALNRDSKIGIDMDSVMMKRLALYAQKNGDIYSPL